MIMTKVDSAPAPTPKKEEEPWLDDAAKKIIVRYEQNVKNSKKHSNGSVFTDQSFPTMLVDLLKSHPLIDQFEAEFALYLVG